MGLESSLFRWDQLNEEERKRKQRLAETFITAASIDKVADEQRKALAHEADVINSFISAVDRLKAKEAAHQIHQSLEFIHTEKKKAQNTVKNAIVMEGHEAGSKVSTDYLAVKTHLIIACDMFSKANDKRAAAALAENIKADLKVLISIDEMGNYKKNTEVSDELVTMGLKAVSMGGIIKDGFTALESEMTAQAEGRVLSDVEKNRNLVAIMKMELVHPSAVIPDPVKAAPELQGFREKKVPERVPVITSQA